MAALTTALLVGSLALTAVGTAVGMKGAAAQAAASKKAEASRMAQMKVDARRQRRDTIRQGIVARSQALFNASNQGASGGSGLPGGYGQITGETNRQVTGINQNENIGSSIFAANRDYYSAGLTQSIGNGMASLGQTMLSNLGPLNRLGTYASSGFGAGAGVPTPPRNPFS